MRRAILGLPQFGRLEGTRSGSPSYGALRKRERSGEERSEERMANGVFMRVFSGVSLRISALRVVVAGVFQVTDTDPHAPASISFQFGAVAFGMLFALLAGYLASFIGGRPHFIAAWIAGGLVALTAIVVMIRKGLGVAADGGVAVHGAGGRGWRMDLRAAPAREGG